jgi:hypothetical protein
MTAAAGGEFLGSDGPRRPRLMSTALRAQSTLRSNLPTVPPQWAVPGVYVLLGPRTDVPELAVWPGAASDLRAELRELARVAPFGWSRALIATRDTTQAFTLTEAQYLAARVEAEVVKSSELVLQQHVERTVGSAPDSVLDRADLLYLDEFVPTLLRLVRLVGSDVAPVAPRRSRGQIALGHVDDSWRFDNRRLAKGRESARAWSRQSKAWTRWLLRRRKT